MSGGIAYVLDEDGAFASRCNAAMVELAPLDDEDARTVRALVEEHVQRTESTKGRSVLAAWDAGQVPFVKVLPLEYKRVLAVLASRREAERSTAKAAS
jgi:glutamate synthase (NADPH/NADH) large chain